MNGNMRVILLALTVAVSQVAVTPPALAQKQGSQQREPKNMTAPATKPGSGTTTNSGMTSTKTTVQTNKKPPADSQKANREHACGNDQNKCYGLYQEMVYPHDARFPARIAAEKAYRDCMAKCVSAPKQAR
jgi:hypothetical protein